ncbi:MAG: chemotaxis protein CheX [Planctomycetota bacterium]|jgi:chemotaxis protein CheX
MDPSYITHFMQSIQNLFSTMLQMEVKLLEPTLKQDPAPSCDVSGIIGLSGDVVGSVVFSLPTETALKVVSRFTGEDVSDPGDETCADAIGELVNMISGGAKAKFEGRNVSMSCPSVVVGTGHTVAIQKEIPCVVIPCDTECGTFNVEIALKDMAAQNAPASSGQAVAG